MSYRNGGQSDLYVKLLPRLDYLPAPIKRRSGLGWIWQKAYPAAGLDGNLAAALSLFQGQFDHTSATVATRVGGTACAAYENPEAA
jgi:hypothetical protein